MTAPQPPVVVLVAPQLGENIGMVARAMLNFGITELRLVSPRNGWPNPAAGPASAGADQVLDRAMVYDDIPTSVADCNRVFTTAMTVRRMLKAIITPAEAVRQTLALPPGGARTAWIFGPERTGLFSGEVAMGDSVIAIPTNPDFGSLNLAMAMTVMGYEWMRQTGDTPPAYLAGDETGPATRHELEGLLGHLEATLSTREYFFPEHRGPTMRQNVRNIFQRQSLTSAEVRTLRGVVKTLSEPWPRIRGT